jgi:hypothetical protein
MECFVFQELVVVILLKVGQKFIAIVGDVLLLKRLFGIILGLLVLELGEGHHVHLYKRVLQNCLRGRTLGWVFVEQL